MTPVDFQKNLLKRLFQLLICFEFSMVLLAVLDFASINTKSLNALVAAIPPIIMVVIILKEKLSSDAQAKAQKTL